MVRLWCRPWACSVFGYYLYAWRRAGRDPSRGTIVPLFAPPDAMSAAAVRYVRRMGFDDRTFTAAILDLAVHGHLKLAEIDKATWLKRRTGGKPIAAPEVAAENKLFPGRFRRPGAEAEKPRHPREGA